jgi:hypothetical protein
MIETLYNGAVEIKHADDLTPSTQGHHELGSGGAIAGDVPGKGVDIRNDDRALLSDSCAADTSTYGNPHAGRLTLEGAKHELSVMHQIKASPVQIRQTMEHKSGHVRHIGDRIALTREQGLQLICQLPIELRLW